MKWLVVGVLVAVAGIHSPYDGSATVTAVGLLMIGVGFAAIARERQAEPRRSDGRWSVEARYKRALAVEAGKPPPPAKAVDIRPAARQRPSEPDLDPYALMLPAEREVARRVDAIKRVHDHHHADAVPYCIWCDVHGGTGRKHCEGAFRREQNKMNHGAPAENIEWTGLTRYHCYLHKQGEQLELLSHAFSQSDAETMAHKWLNAHSNELDDHSCSCCHLDDY